MSDVALRCVLGGQQQDVFVSSGWLRMRDRGNWTAYVESSNTVAPAELSPASVLVRREDGVTVDTFVGAVRRAKVNPGSQKLAVTVAGGAGKLIFPLPPLDHVLGTGPIPAGVVARAICDAAGEQLAPGVEQALDAILLPRWHRATDTSGAVALDLLTWQLSGAGGSVSGQPAYTWRVLPSGLVWIGVETWPAVNGAAYWTGLNEDDGGVTYAPRGAPLLVGQSVDGVSAIDVRYQVGAMLTCEVRGAVSGDPPHVPDLDLYRLSYSATVKTQNADGTLDVICDDARIGDLRRLILRVGLPGALVTVDPTTTPPPRVRVRFDGASPAGAFAEGLDQDAAATLPVALAAGYLLAGTMTVGVGAAPVVVNLGWSSSASGPFTVIVAVPVASPATPPAGTGTAITTPSARVKLQ